jgi:hypothetical protein
MKCKRDSDARAQYHHALQVIRQQAFKAVPNDETNTYSSPVTRQLKSGADVAAYLGESQLMSKFLDLVDMAASSVFVMN